MKFIVSEQELEVPADVKVTIKAREVIVKGKLGELKKSFRHIPFELRQIVSEKSKKNVLNLRMWMQKKKQNSLLRTVRSTIANMMTGVTVGYKFKMVLAYAHFPIVLNILNEGRTVEIKNFLGFKINKRINTPEGVVASKKEEEKDIITVVGVSLEDVSRFCARLQQATVIQNKDLRAFLDGIYVQDARLEFND